MNSQINSNPIQIEFLGQIRNKHSGNMPFADELAEILNISRDSAYRRIRGETVLSLDEVKILYDKYGLSIDGIISPESNMVLLNHQSIDFNYSLKEWLKSIIQNLEKASMSLDPNLIFAAKDIPVLHYFGFPEIIAFKLFVWLKSVIKEPSYEQLIYSPGILPNEILTQASKAHQLFCQLPSTEVWSDEIINGTLKQIEYYNECNFFSNKDIPIRLYDQLVDLIQTLKLEAAEGKKSGGGKFELYQNEILIPDNTIFANLQNQRIVFINYNTMDLLTSMQPSFCEKTELYMKNLIKNSTLISVTAEKERNRFFNKIHQKIVASRQKTI